MNHSLPTYTVSADVLGPANKANDIGTSPGTTTTNGSTSASDNDNGADSDADADDEEND